MRRIRQLLSMLGESFKGLRRNIGMALASIISIASMLTLFGMVLLLIININSSVYHLGNELDKVVIYLKDEVTTDSVNNMIKTISSDERVKTVQYTSKEMALENFKKSFGDNAHILDSLPKNTLPPSLTVTLKDLSYASDFSEVGKSFDGVIKVDYHYELVKKMMSVENGVKYVGTAIVMVLLFVSILIIHNTIKIAVANRSREINIMKYIGATDAYIRGPFLIEGAIFGILGAILSFALVFYVYSYFYAQVGFDVQNIFGIHITTPESIGRNISIIFMCIGIGIGYLGSLASTQRFLDV